ncbi:MAG: hypothetical protein JW881_17840 [Spirochaetales bacterium]|nr:hypothetical protein [Spirochaetales bacterium]
MKKYFIFLVVFFTITSLFAGTSAQTQDRIMTQTQDQQQLKDGSCEVS